VNPRSEEALSFSRDAQRTTLLLELGDQEVNERARYATARMTASLMEPYEQLAAQVQQAEVELEVAAKGGDRQREQKARREKQFLTEQRDRLAPLKREWEKTKGQFDLRKSWLDRMTNQAEDRTRLLATQGYKAPERARTNERVGVWTDDYSNLLSVFNWGK